MVANIEELERRIDHAIAAPIVVNAEMGGISLGTMGEVMEFAKLMAVSGAAVPMYLRGNPGACLAICSRALRWQMDPFAVAEKSYMMVNPKTKEERIAFEAQLVHAVITARAPLKSRLRHEILGEGDERRCRVWGTFRGEDKQHEYTSETLAKLIKARGRNEYGNVKGSPLWDTQPEVQLAYSTYRQWCRLYASETLLGVYTPDELHESNMVDVTPPNTPIENLKQRLRDAKKAHVEAKTESRGFDADHVGKEAAARSSIIDGEVNSDDAEQKEVNDGDFDRRGNEPDTEGRQDAATGGADDTAHEVGGTGVLAADRSHVGQPAGVEATGEEAGGDQADVFPPDRKPVQKATGKR